MITIRRVKDISKIPGLVEHIEKTWGMGHATWIYAQRWWWIGFEKNSKNSIDFSRFVCYSGAYSYGMSGDHYCSVLGPTWVSPEYRGHSLQLQMLKKRIKFLKGLEYTKLWSSTYADNYPSMNNLIKAGFHIVAPWCKAEDNSLYWEKII